ncbi:MAG: AraC family transcriptional regulator [Hyphomicrobiaceae bacterium]
MRDVLSDIFDTIRLRGTLYFRTDFSPPWATTVPAYEQAARFHLVVQGTCHVALPSGRREMLGPGDLILIPRGLEHTLSDEPDRPAATLERVVQESGYDGRGVFSVGAGDQNAKARMICGHLGFTQGADHPLLRALPEAIVMSTADRVRHPLLDDTLRLVARRAFSDGLGSSASIARLSEVFFIEAVRAAVSQSPELARVLDAMGDPYIGRSLDLMHSAPADPWSVESLAIAIGMSRSRFAERFTELMGIAPIAYLSEWRLQKALGQLTETEASVKQVARDVGYQSPAAFTRAFAQRFGIAPTAYRGGDIARPD